MPHSGSCLCGKTTIEVASTHESQIMCHCTDCQQTSGSHASTNILAKQSDVTIKGSEKEYDSKASSGNTVTRVFCGNCGSAIAHKSKAFGDAMAIQTGNFKDFRSIPFEAELFVKDRWSGVPEVPKANQVQVMPE